MDRQKGNWAKINFNYTCYGNQHADIQIWSLITDNLPETHLTHISLYREINHPEKMKTYSCRHLKIERNDTEIQAVNNRKSGILQIVFFKPGTFDNEEIKVKALKPCVVQIKRSKGKVTDMQIADPQNQEKLKPGVDVIIL